jgi:hypothetical protein
MRFSEMASRLTGLSTPFFGVSWQPPVADREVAREVIAYLEDRGALYEPHVMEFPPYTVDAVMQIRAFLTEVIARCDVAPDLDGHLRAMRAACYEFSRRLGRPPENQHTFLPPQYGRHSARRATITLLKVAASSRSLHPFKVLFVPAKENYFEQKPWRVQADYGCSHCTDIAHVRHRCRAATVGDPSSAHRGMSTRRRRRDDTSKNGFAPSLAAGPARTAHFAQSRGSGTDCRLPCEGTLRPRVALARIATATRPNRRVPNLGRVRGSARSFRFARSRVAGGIAAPGSHRSRRDSLPSPGSSDQPRSTCGFGASG